MGGTTTKGLAMARIGDSDLDVLPLAVGGNVFGWTADEPTSFALLDAFAQAPGLSIDTADGYSHWVPGHGGGESETIIGRWFAARPGARDRVVVATKVSSHPQFRGLSGANIAAAARASLQRLQTDRIDLYWAHHDDASAPLAETAAAFSRLVDEGLVRWIGLSNYSPERIDEWFAIASRDGLHRPVAYQPQYNLLERAFEGAPRDRAERYRLGVLPYYALASGFLSGKYRADAPTPATPRADRAAQYLDDRGRRVLAALDEVAAAHGAPVASVALAWLRVQPTVVAPIASASRVDQVPALLASTTLDLAPDEVAALTAASA
jgi:aryl-alcohol dehydrogenase-like predicted oxidoreductase